MDILIFLAGSSLLACFLTSLLKAIIKQKIEPRWGNLGIHAFLLLIAILLAGGGIALELIPDNISTAIIAIFAGSVAIYEVLVKTIYQRAIKNQIK